MIQACLRWITDRLITNDLSSEQWARLNNTGLLVRGLLPKIRQGEASQTDKEYTRYYGMIPTICAKNQSKVTIISTLGPSYRLTGAVGHRWFKSRAEPGSTEGRG